MIAPMQGACAATCRRRAQRQVLGSARLHLAVGLEQRQQLPVPIFASASSSSIAPSKPAQWAGCQSAREQREFAGRGEGIRVHATRAQHVLGGVCM